MALFVVHIVTSEEYNFVLISGPNSLIFGLNLDYLVECIKTVAIATKLFCSVDVP